MSLLYNNLHYRRLIPIHRIQLLFSEIQHIGVKSSQLTLGARHFCPKIMNEKLSKCPNFYHICRKKITKFPNVTRYLLRKMKMPEFYTNWQKNIFPNYGGTCPPLCFPPSLAPMIKGMTIQRLIPSTEFSCFLK